jgi:two-component system chemotaxis sensor kinase CheA
LSEIFRLVPDQVQFAELPAAAAGEPAPSGTACIGDETLVAAVLAEQCRVLRAAQQSDDREGRIRSVVRVAANALRHDGRAGDAANIEAAGLEALAQAAAAPLLSALERHAPDRAAAAEADTPAGIDTRQAEQPRDRTLRVAEQKIEALVNLSSELVLLKHGVARLAMRAEKELGEGALAMSARQQRDAIERLAGEMHAAILRLRMVPVAQAFQSFPRLVRDLSRQLDKRVQLVTEGETVEIDKIIIDRMFEPLMHLLRNAIDHGIETSERRNELGKPKTATITFRAHRHLESVIVEVEDDGRGIDTDRVREVAAHRNLLPSDVLAAMDDNELVALIFAPGFSTASEITGLSGRGVGMDSVKAAVERLGGSVVIDSRSGRGTAVRLILPFTVMMTRVMTVETAGQVFGFPLDTVVETAAVPRDHLVAVGRGRAFALRDRTIPLVDLAESLGLARSGRADGEVKVVVTAAAGLVGGVEVEKLGERMDIMLKPMAGLLKNMRGVAGTTLLGDGRVLIVLDVQELFQ